MYRHLSKNTFCRHTRKHYFDRFRSKFRFHSYLDVRNAITEHGRLPVLEALADHCGPIFGRDYLGKVLKVKFERQCRLLEKIARMRLDTQPSRQSTSSSDPSPATMQSSPITVEESIRSGPDSLTGNPYKDVLPTSSCSPRGGK
ncbi:hypothetical protein NCS56_01515700 [Fusarium sp. Ph1]|nr:hypothetical protein NCS56_01515700 [Fusarium sp. Ph1]